MVLQGIIYRFMPGFSNGGEQVGVTVFCSVSLSD